jgi:putative transposase
MPIRVTPLINNEIYHVVNRGVASSPVFNTKWDYRRFTETFIYYQNVNLPTKLSKFISFSREEREKIRKTLATKSDHLISIMAYCLMPNHFHFLLKQLRKNGISHFIRRTTNSYSHYFNLKHKRRGTLFGGRFKAVRIENDSQLLHVSRYIHLNPYSSFLVKELKSLLKYPYSSLPEYLSLTKESICQKEILSSFFKEPQDHRKFIFDQADYQRSLEVIKHKLLEK